MFVHQTKITGQTTVILFNINDRKENRVLFRIVTVSKATASLDEICLP